jgi:hypothetical protein
VVLSVGGDDATLEARVLNGLTGKFGTPDRTSPDLARIAAENTGDTAYNPQAHWKSGSMEVFLGHLQNPLTPPQLVITVASRAAYYVTHQEWPLGEWPAPPLKPILERELAIASATPSARATTLKYLLHGGPWSADDWSKLDRFVLAWLRTSPHPPARQQAALQLIVLQLVDHLSINPRVPAAMHLMSALESELGMQFVYYDPDGAWRVTEPTRRAVESLDAAGPVGELSALWQLRTCSAPDPVALAQRGLNYAHQGADGGWFHFMMGDAEADTLAFADPVLAGEIARDATPYRARADAARTAAVSQYKAAIAVLGSAAPAAAFAWMRAWNALAHIPMQPRYACLED